MNGQIEPDAASDALAKLEASDALFARVAGTRTLTLNNRR